MRSILYVSIIAISFSFLSYLLLIPLQTSVLVGAEDLTNNSRANNEESWISVPPTISNESQKILGNLAMDVPTFTTPSPDDLEGWNSLNQQLNSMAIQLSQPIVENYRSKITATNFAGINVLDIKPKDWKENGKVLVYVHGGGYTLLGANSTLGNAVTVANSTGLRVISIDYSLAPFSKWNQTTYEVVSVMKALMDKGYSLDDIALYGDSAGGGLAAGSVIRMRDEGLGIPAALALWSPLTDVTGTGDTHFTLKNADPFLSGMMLKNMADAYADPSDQKNPYVSPVYGNFSKGFPSTLIQGGTKEVLLSDFVRLYQALDQAGIPVKLDIYEGMPHGFQTFFFYNTTESNMAISKTSDFLRGHLNY